MRIRERLLGTSSAAETGTGSGHPGGELSAIAEHVRKSAAVILGVAPSDLEPSVPIRDYWTRSVNGV
jgi:hypothetical protein